MKSHLVRPAMAARAWQVSAAGGCDYLSREDIRVAPAVELLAELV